MFRLKCIHIKFVLIQNSNENEQTVLKRTRKKEPNEEHLYLVIISIKNL